MIKLKANCGRIEVKCLGLVLTQKSTEEEILRALKKRPSLSNFVTGLKKGQNLNLTEPENKEETK